MTTPAAPTATKSPSRAERGAAAAKADAAKAAKPAATPAKTPAKSAPKTPAAPAAPKTPAVNKRARVFAALCRAAGDALDGWSDPDVTKAEAKSILAHRLSYCGGDASVYWDSRLGPAPKGRGQTA